MEAGKDCSRLRSAAMPPQSLGKRGFVILERKKRAMPVPRSRIAISPREAIGPEWTVVQSH